MNDPKRPILPSRPAEPSVPVLDGRAQRLLESLPDAHRLVVTRRYYPHVIDRLAADWHVPQRMVAVFGQLLLDHRGDRSGFPFAAALELMQLREYYVGTLHPELRPEPTARDPEVWR